MGVREDQRSGGVGDVYNCFVQTSAYGFMPSLVGSEMCIRGSPLVAASAPMGDIGGAAAGLVIIPVSFTHLTLPTICIV